MATYLNQSLWKKAYLLEFKMNSTLTDAFTFAVPPESEDFTFPQRINETKTFGGAVIDDYGNDMIKISLSGSTINEELKIIYKSLLGQDFMSGEQEIFYLRDLLKKYGKQENLSGKEVYLYALNGGDKKTNSNPKWWKVYTTELQIKRAKDRPFVYNYTITFTALPEEVKARKKKSLFGGVEDLLGWDSTLQNFFTKVNQTIDDIQSYATIASDWVAYFPNVASNLVNQVTNTVSKFNTAVSSYVNVLNLGMEAVENLAQDTVQLGDTIFETGSRYYPTMATNVVNTAKDMWNACLNIGTFFTETIPEYCTEGTANWTNFVNSFNTSSDESEQTVTAQDVLDVTASTSMNCVDNAEYIYALVKKYINQLGFTVIPGDTGESDKLVVTYGYSTVTLTDAETSWDQLAQDYFGDSSLGCLIANYNNLDADTDLKAGLQIQIPYLSMSTSNLDRVQVYNDENVKDNYGKDIEISEEGDISLYNGDVDTVTGADNLSQALQNRLTSMIGSRIRDEVYGIQTTIGNAAEASSSLIQASVEQTLLEEPRVQSVESIKFVGAGDNLQLEVTYVDVNGAIKSFGGII